MYLFTEFIFHDSHAEANPKIAISYYGPSEKKQLFESELYEIKQDILAFKRLVHK